jgi:phosphoribosylformimino-5-aminoimidazole carboxamide ribotide isomerase
MEDETVFSNEPEKMAMRWYREGAERLHVVDLNGAVMGSPVNKQAIKRIVDAVPIPVQLGGGIRDLSVLKAYMDLGISYAIIGTAACRDPVFVEEACRLYPGRIILGVDARSGRISVQGWTEDIPLSPLELIRRFTSLPIFAVVYTDISKDGMRTGPNIEATAALAREISLPVIASGGISGISDVLALARLSDKGIMGAITGRAIYDGALDFKKAVEALKNFK